MNAKKTRSKQTDSEFWKEMGELEDECGCLAHTRQMHPPLFRRLQQSQEGSWWEALLKAQADIRVPRRWRRGCSGNALSWALTLTPSWNEPYRSRQCC